MNRVMPGKDRFSPVEPVQIGAPDVYITPPDDTFGKAILTPCRAYDQQDRLSPWPAGGKRVSVVVMSVTSRDLSRKYGVLRDGVGLTLRIHFHALCHAPVPYLTASWWRLRGKRVRARAQFAPLLATSPLAYRFWQRHETIPDGHRTADEPAIVALVDATGAEPEMLADTLRSLAAEGIEAVSIGTSLVRTCADAAEAIDWTRQPWLMLLAAGDRLARGAAGSYRAAVIAAQGTIVYADDDVLDAQGRRHAPHFKPMWNAELFRHFDYLTGACIVRVAKSTLADRSAQDWAVGLVAAALAQKDRTPIRIPHILHHRRQRPLPRIPAAFAHENGELPPVSVVIPTRNRHDLLRKCIEGLERTDYPAMDIIIVDNGSDDPATLAYLGALDPERCRVLRVPGPFNFSTLNNHAVREADGRLLCLLNNDVEVIAPDWLAIMARQALRPDVGAVGAQLLYPDGRIQHAGVVLGIGGGAAHAHRLLHPDDDGYFRRHAVPQFVSAVTAACLVVQRTRFEAVGGLDEANFAVAFNDVDLCLRLNQRGWQSFYEPRARLFHHESVSRGLDRDPVGAARLAGELAALQERWSTDRIVDPFHHPHLNRFSERFAIRL